MTISRRLFSLLALSLISGVLAVSSTRAQSFQFQFDNICTFFDQIPQTEGVRSTLAEEWVSGSWAASDRVIYNRSGGMVTDIVFQERSSGSWENVTRAIPTYDASDRLETCTLQDWDSGASEWSDIARTSRTYNTDGNVERAVFEQWDESAGDWADVSRIEYTSYDSNDNLLVQIDQFWDGTNWMNVRRTENTYAGGNLTEELEQTWIGSWFNDYRTTNTYDTSDRLTEVLEEDWDLIGSQWVNDGLTTYTYANTPTTVTEVWQTWNGSWINVGRTTTNLNNNDLPAEVIEDTWSGTNWVRADRTETDYVSVSGTPKIFRILDQTCSADCVTSKAAVWENSTQTTFSYSEVLPVELTAFTVAEADDAAVLAWTTATETNNAGFEVQRRVGAEGRFAAIGFVDGAGTTSRTQSYRFRDAALPFDAAQVTYRLKQVDLDGTTAYSPEVEFSRAVPERLVLHGNYPNPFQGHTRIRYELPQAGLVQMDVFNMLGQRVARLVDRPQPAGRSEVVFDAQTLPSGTYFVRLAVDGQSRLRQVTVVR